MIDFRFFPYIVKDIVEKTRAKYDTTNNVLPYFEFGTYLQLVAAMQLRSKSNQKYPLVWLVWEASYSKKIWQDDISYQISPKIFILTGTKPETLSLTRYQINFEGVLHPILSMMQRQLEGHANVSMKSANKRIEVEHLYWGEGEGFDKDQSVIFDNLDAIEVQWNNLIIEKTC